MGRTRQLTVVPLVGPFHTRWPRYNVVHIREAVKAFKPDLVALASLAGGALDEQFDPLWQDTDEVALPHTVVPWAKRAGVRLLAVGLAGLGSSFAFDGSAAAGSRDPDDPGDPGAEADLLRFLQQYEDGRARLAAVEAALEPVRRLLAQALGPERIRSELLPAIAAQQAERRRLLDHGPGDGWLDERAALVASRALAAGGERIALLAGVDRVPALERVLADHVELLDAPRPDAGEEGRQRALLDVAMRGEVDDVAALLDSLGRLDVAEARYHEANLLLANNHPAEALERLEALLRLEFHEPYFLPGFALARLGQLYDLAGRRREAVRSYRGVLALSYSPAAARAAAESGLAEEFSLSGPAE